MPKVYDYIVIGAGSAGCVMANRLSQDGSKVLLLEAGKKDSDPLIKIPIGIGKIFPERRHDWNYFFEPEDAVAGRAVECARGKVLGGSSSINMMTYTRGHKSDYDSWAEAGLKDWSFEKVLPYFKKLETWEGGEDEFRGGSGPLKVQQTKFKDPIVQAILQAGAETGHGITPDYNGKEQAGFGLSQETIHNGRRWSAASAYLHNAAYRPSLKVQTNAKVLRLRMRGSRVEGVEYAVGSEHHVAFCSNDVILSAGVINSPQLLMLSGIGPADHLREVGIRPLVDLPGVGLNLQDHYSVMLSFLRRSPSTFLRQMRYDKLVLSMANAALFGRGFASDVPAAVMAFIRTQFAQKAPDIQLLFLAAAYPSAPYLPPFSQPFRDSFGCRVALLRPESTGRVRLASSSPESAPRIFGNFLSTDSDKKVLKAGISLARDVMNASALRDHVIGEAPSSAGVQSESDLDEYLRKTGVTVHHPVGTCRMGLSNSRDTVVDENLRVLGIDGLRVVDASVIPKLVGGNINGVVMMVAEKAADIVAGRNSGMRPSSDVTAEFATAQY